MSRSPWLVSPYANLKYWVSMNGVSRALYAPGPLGSTPLNTISE